MSKVWVSSDWHIGHKNIYKFRCREKGFYRDFIDEATHRQWLFQRVRKLVGKRDTLYLLGDIAFDEEALIKVGKLPGRKVLIGGNHDVKKSEHYQKVYDMVVGCTSYKGYWMSHFPLHPTELRGKKALHGHTHYVNIEDERYYNCCVDNLMREHGEPIVLFDAIKSMMNKEGVCQ